MSTRLSVSDQALSRLSAAPQQDPPNSSSPWVLSTKGPTASRRYNATFVREVCLEVLVALEGMPHPDVVLTAYSAPWHPDDEPQGQLTIRLLENDQRAELGIVFGAPGDTPGVPFRSYFNDAAFEADRTNPHACEIFVASFDECWALVCSILDGISPNSVRFSFGA